ncbi:MAG: hypothetical protein WAQ57_02935 [Candidatus Saccharimonadales bacterium]
MTKRVISADTYGRGAGPNPASLMRDAVLDAMPEACHGCPEAFERSYRIGQLALRENIPPRDAAEWAWGNPGVCCREAVEIDWVPAEIIPSAHKVPEFAGV